MTSIRQRVTSAALFYLRHLRSCAATAHGASSTAKASGPLGGVGSLPLLDVSDICSALLRLATTVGRQLPTLICDMVSLTALLSGSTCSRGAAITRMLLKLASFHTHPVACRCLSGLLMALQLPSLGLTVIPLWLLAVTCPDFPLAWEEEEADEAPGQISGSLLAQGEMEKADQVYFNGLAGPLSSMHKMRLREAPTCLQGVRLHFHQARGLSFFAVKVFKSSTDMNLIDRDATYDDLGEPEDFLIVFTSLGVEKSEQLFKAAEARVEEDAALHSFHKALEEVDANVRDERGETAASKVCRFGHLKMLKSLRLALADFTLADSQGVTPLFLACQEGHVTCASFLLEVCGHMRVCISPDGELPERWVDFVDRPLASNATSLYVASQNGHRKTVQLLIAHRADVNLATRDNATPVFIAAQMGNEGIVDDLIEAKADIHSANNTGATPLFIASQNARLEIAKKLMALGAETNSETIGGATPLYIAAQKDNRKIAEVLVEKGALVNEQAHDGATPLLIAAQNGNLSTVMFLLSLQAVQQDLCMHSGASPVCVSAQNNHLAVVKALVRCRSDANLCLKSNVSPVYIAAQNGNLEVLKYLLEKTPDLKDKPAIGDATPLFIACQNGHDIVVAVLIQQKAQYNCTEDGSTPLLVAAQNGHLAVIKALWAEMGPAVALNRAKRGGATPLYIACQNGHFHVVQWLLEHGADAHKSLQSQETPLFIACQGGYLDVVRVLVEAGVDVDASKKDGASPLYIACQNGHVEVVRYLLCESPRKPDADLANCNQATPLFIASQKGHEVIVELLLNTGASVDKALKSGATPFYIAALKGHSNVVIRLQEAGAVLNSTPKHGATPISAAVQNGHLEVAKLLIKMRADVSKPNCEGMAPLHYAAKDCKLEMVELLLEYNADPAARTRCGRTAWDLAKEGEEVAGNEAPGSSSSNDTLPKEHWAAIAKKLGTSCAPASAA